MMLKKIRIPVFLLVIFSFLLIGCAPSQPASKPRKVASFKGAWVQGGSIKTKAMADEVIRKAVEGGFNSIFVGVFGDGYTGYPSHIAPQIDVPDPNFDSLAYIVSEAHKHNIKVHAWFAVGRIGQKGDSPIIAQHPDWGLIGPDGRKLDWFNFTNPDARKFMSDLMLETVQRYGVDGVHFDYTRYPDYEWGFDDYSIKAFSQEYGFDLNQLRYSDLPAYGLFEGNALGNPITAQVLASFSDGTPAVTLNRFGEGETLVLNWQASNRNVAVSTAILRNGVNRLRGENGSVYILRSEINIEKYGGGGLDSAVAWLQFIGWDPKEITEADISGLDAGSVLILPYTYYISSDTAAHLAEYVKKGGGAIFIDGPTKSINLLDLQAVTGMLSSATYFKGWTLMTTTGENPIVPSSDRPADIKLYETWNSRWNEFRSRGINALIEDVYKRVKDVNPNTLVTITITSDQGQAAQINLQDWKTWLDKGYIDALMPRLYVDNKSDLSERLSPWKDVAREYGSLTFGLSDHSVNDPNKTPKPVSELQDEIRIIQSAGSNGYMIFDLDHISDDQLKMLGQ